MTERRPDPDALLARAREEEARASRGRLKIFFGASPGVGKTYAMLEAARAKRTEGVEIVVGVVETHGRQETAALLEGLEVLPRRRLEYRGVVIEEFDLDAALARRPGVILVDELAHTNAVGSRHTKRWQDVEELLAAGINVYGTLNVQHLASLNDIVAQITGVKVQETLPDSVLEQADDIELVDLSPDDLLRRLKEGKVYLPDQAARAIEQFFRKGNLIALRELAMRRAAERVDAQMRGYMAEHGIHETWPAGERLLICIGPNPAGARLVRAGKRMAVGLKCPWTVAYVESPGQAVSISDREALAANLLLADQLGAQTTTLSGHDAAEEILSYSRTHNVTKIVAGKPTHPRWRDKLFGSMLDRLIRGSADIDVYVITGDVDEGYPRPAQVASSQAPLGEYLRAGLVVVICTAVNLLVFRFLSVTDVAMVYLLGAGVVAARYGRGPTIFASFLSIAGFDFFFVPPHLTFAVTDLKYLLTFGVMLGIALVIGTLTARIRDQAKAAREREGRTAALYALSRELTIATNRADLAAAASRHVQESIGGQVQLFLPDVDGRLAIPEGAPRGYPVDQHEEGVADWVFRRGQAAGVGTDTLPGAKALYLPLSASGGSIGVIGIQPADPQRLLDPQVRRLLEAFAGQTALALERAVLAERSRHEQVEIEAERLRTSLLSSVSHDLRTPLGAITGAASSMLQDGAPLNDATRRDLAETIVEESQRMNRLIGNLLDMIRVESGALQVQKEWQPLEDTVGVALIRLDERLKDHPVKVDLPPELPLVPLDAVLVEQVMINLLENAAKYTPAGTPIAITAREVPGAVQVDVADHGPGLPPGAENRIFDKFFRASPDKTPSGIGLGLSICRGIVTAHGGTIWAENRAGGGAAFHFTLPLSGAPPVGVPAEIEAE